MNHKTAFKIFIAFIALTGLVKQSSAQGPTYIQRPPMVITDNPSITIAGGTADTLPTPTAGVHQASVTFAFGTVSGAYTGCTVQAKTSLDGTNYFLFGAATSITVTTGTNNIWQLIEGTSVTASTTTAQTFGLLMKFTLACAGSYGTSAPVTVTVAYVPNLGNASLTIGALPLPAGASTSANQVTTPDTNTGNASGSTQRVVLATNQPAVPVSIGSTVTVNFLTPTLAENVAQINGVTPLMGNGVTGTGSQRVTISSDNTAFSVNNTQQGTAADNITQFGGVAVSTGTGTSGTGIPRVTVSSDSSMIGTLASNGTAAGTNRFGVLPGIAQSQLQAAATAGRDIAPQTDLFGTSRVANFPLAITTYVAAGSGTLATTATDIAVLPGNATNTVIVTQVEVSCTQTTAAINDLLLIKRSAADTSGTSSAMTVVPLDSGNAGAVSAPLFYTANPTLGAAVGTVDRQKTGFNAATGTNSDLYLWKPTMGQSFVLRGTAQQIAVNMNSQTTTGGACNVVFTWIETTGL